MKFLIKALLFVALIAEIKAEVNVSNLTPKCTEAVMKLKDDENYMKCIKYINNEDFTGFCSNCININLPNEIETACSSDSNNKVLFDLSIQQLTMLNENKNKFCDNPIEFYNSFTGNGFGYNNNTFNNNIGINDGFHGNAFAQSDTSDHSASDNTASTNNIGVNDGFHGNAFANNANNVNKDTTTNSTNINDGFHGNGFANNATSNLSNVISGNSTVTDTTSSSLKLSYSLVTAFILVVFNFIL
ncbi:hypothetical protein BCR36DRAFT_584062 [Piromyces finnis]|uniref:Uncharacterized protein n=1 Tax=Piromyces finnis TaxID=1754191 RepID=A0A1Y1V943_9FUNG|nr:hypothetical protein BCR36DRAFT_584062 [Piromyces finnis]|eukprot:ORX48942.1 hypothetical protein BCR36DRAFT_584062 [Piromyces finnis]